MSDDINTGPYPGTYALVTPDKPAVIRAAQMSWLCFMILIVLNVICSSAD